MYGKFTIIYLDLVDFHHRFVGKYTKPRNDNPKIFCGPKTHREVGSHRISGGFLEEFCDKLGGGDLIFPVFKYFPRETLKTDT